MYLTSRFSSSFEKRVRSRGQSYFEDRCVDIVEGSKEIVRAVVSGSYGYDVSLKIKGRELLAACTCPYYDNDLCKHIWATMLAAQRKGYLTGTDHPPTRLVMSDENFDGEDDGYDGEDGYDDDDEYRDYEDKRPTPPSRLKAQPSAKPWQQRPHSPDPKPPVWQQWLESVNRSMRTVSDEQTRPWPASRELFYIVDVKSTLSGTGLAISLGYREIKRNGEWGKIRTTGLPSIRVAQLPEPDCQIVAMLVGGREHYSYSYSYSSQYSNAPASYKLFEPLDQTLLPMMCKTGRCRLLVNNATQTGDNASKAEMRPLDWDDGEPWAFWLEVRTSEASKQLVTIGSLRRGDERMELSEPALLTPALVFARGRAARLNDFDAFPWIVQLRTQGPLYAPANKGNVLLEKVLLLPKVPPLDLPEELQYEEVAVAPRPRLKLAKLERASWQTNQVGAELSFDYGGRVVAEDDQRKAFFESETRRLLFRDSAVEQSASERMRQLGFARQSFYYDPQPLLVLATKKMPLVVKTLVKEGWHVEAEGNIYREPREFRIEVTSGIDWFELHGTVDFGDAKANLPELIAALKRGDNTVVLGDGTFGLLPEEWLKKYGLLASLGSTEADHLRFTKSQVGLLDALLASQPEASFDETFSRAREELQRFEGVRPADSPPSFTGILRGYQRDGLGWLHFLQQFGFGGCLADDMGLGKTVQVLALLESRRIERNGAHNDASRPGKKKARAVESDRRLAPSLVVVPKSLVFNWIQEGARFTPKLRVLDHTGMDRLRTCDHFEDYDLIITTYGTLRRDAIQFKEVQFDYVILDEAQAIKNANTESAKAARLLRGNHRLAMSGTPIENHLGELWSLFQFLNPGLLGAASVFKLNTSAARNPDEQVRALLAKALRPFILRRTKQQVASDLPPKTEQTIYCEMESGQRKLYDELRDHYRRSLLGLIQREGIKKSKIQILEALLRLRQAACHPALIDKSRKHEPSAKLDVLLPQISEVIDEGHKALVFSQFTSFLAIVRDRLDRDGVTYEYLDGQTRDRAARVQRFQCDPDCKLFLISLKAGGLGLNLTAADYVFLLDPWWNPAVEAQAIDRAHRIGQSQQIFAYRLIARDTVEEKVLELQATKRELADAIINADNSLIRTLGREDLELLLS
ncbi:MAG: DEAD/DEAH box helicase [Acidobacteriota bacterium]